MDLCGDAQESRMILVAMIDARDHSDTGNTGTFRQSRRRCGESRGGQGVCYDRALLGRETGRDKAIGRGLRIADNGIAPAKRGALSAELRGCHEVSELAMAPDDDGHAGKLGGGNQREIGIEIEGVGDLHAMMAEISGEIEPSAQRLQSEKTAAEGELGGVRKVVGDRATAADAAEISLKLRMGEMLRED